MKVQKTVKFYTKNGKRYMDILISQNEIITLSQKEILKKTKQKPKNW